MVLKYCSRSEKLIQNEPSPPYKFGLSSACHSRVPHNPKNTNFQHVRWKHISKYPENKYFYKRAINKNSRTKPMRKINPKTNFNRIRFNVTARQTASSSTNSELTFSSGVHSGLRSLQSPVHSISPHGFRSSTNWWPTLLWRTFFYSKKQRQHQYKYQYKKRQVPIYIFFKLLSKLLLMLRYDAADEKCTQCRAQMWCITPDWV